MDAILKPLPGKIKLNPKDPVIMVAVKPDLELLTKSSGYNKNSFKHIYMSRFYHEDGKPSVIGPFMGAPYAVMLIENIICWGAKEIVFFGWCGAISEDLQIGDIVIPEGAFCDEGTSKNYIANDYVETDYELTDKVRNLFSNKNIDFKSKKIWTTDGVFRETPEKVKAFAEKGASAVEMELSALLTVSNYRGIKASAVLIVSDEIFTGTYNPGHKSKRFKENRQIIAETLNLI
ncbi:MAG: nucleoside phosphorylase [Desulfobacterales bacterium]|nr:nucleoside phosphorylase [Desulfobacterales bacterium]